VALDSAVPAIETAIAKCKPTHETLRHRATRNIAIIITIIIRIERLVFISCGSKRLNDCTDKINAIQNRKLKTKFKPRDNELNNMECSSFKI